MPIYNYKCKCGFEEEKLSGCHNEDLHCSQCGELMERQSSLGAMRLLNRQKPTGFKYSPGEMNADKDIWAQCKRDEELGKLDANSKRYWFNELKDKVEH